MNELKYNEQLTSLEGRIKRQEKDLKLISEADDNDDMLEQLDMLICSIERQRTVIATFSTELFDEIVDRIIVNNNEIIFRLVSGIELSEPM